MKTLVLVLSLALLSSISFAQIQMRDFQGSVPIPALSSPGTGKIGLHIYGPKLLGSFVLGKYTATSNSRLSAATYGENMNLDSLSKEIFGTDASLTDWANIKALIGSDNAKLAEFYKNIGLTDGASAMVSKDGNRFYESTRQYYLQRLDNGPYGGFLVHDQIGTLYLGSWFGLNMNILANTVNDTSSSRLSAATYSENINLDSLSKEIFGTDASLADWANIKALIGSDNTKLAEFYKNIGLTDGASAMVSKDGNRFYGSTRQYYLQRLDNGPYGGFLVHDQIGTLYLGSWYGLNMNILAYLSTASTSNTAPAAPQNLAAIPGTGQVTLKWNKNTEADFLRYRVYMGTDSVNVTLKDSTTASILDTSKVITGLTNGTKYYFRVSSLDSTSLESEKSYAASATPFSSDLIQVSGGTFTALVTISSFNIDKYEVTYELWTAVRNWALTNGYASADIAVGTNGYNPVGTNNPVTEVNWYDVLKWCNARSEKDGLTPVYCTSNTLATVYRAGQLDLDIAAVKWSANGYRLPTEAEWEFAARGGTSSQGYNYSGSGDSKWYFSNSGGSTHTVGTKQPNELGIYDMSGNVWEWCWDWFGNYSSEPQTDPKGGADHTGYRVLRGGSFASNSGFDDDCSVGFRNYDLPNNRGLTPVRNAYYGFRCARIEGQAIDTTTWKMQLKATVGTALDNENYVGVADSATENFDLSFDKPELPSAPANYVSLFFPHPEWDSSLGNDFAVDIKQATPLADTVKRWYFQVRSDVVSDTVTLTFVNDRIPSAFGEYLTDLKTGKRTNLRNTSFYEYYNTSDTARSFMLIIGDSTAPQLTLTSPNGSNIWRSGTTKTIEWSTSDGTGIDSIFVYSSSNSGNAYALSHTLSYAQSTCWTVPIEYLNHNYSIKVISRDSLGNQSAVRSAKSFSVVGDSLATNNAAGWSLMSLPLQPSDSTAANIIGDDLSSNPYYLGSYEQSTGYVIPSTLQFGMGYWLGLISSTTWDVCGAAVEADSTVVDLPVGYTIVGSSFVRDVPKQGISFRKGGVDFSFADAVTQGILVNAIYGYNGTSYETKDTLQMFKGYWLGILQSGVQMIQKPIVSTVTPLMKTIKSRQSGWDLPIIASSSSHMDQLAKIGVKPNATDDFDVAYDVPRPPRAPGNSYIELYFPHSGQQYPAILGSKYALDYRGTNNPQWSFIVESSDSGQITLLWDKTILTQIGNSIRLTLTDATTSTSIDMAKLNSYAFTYTTPRTFNIASVITGITSDEEAKPVTFALGQNYPNPFNPSTMIQFTIPKTSSVTLKVYDVLGKEIISLVKGELSAGTYSRTWNAEKAPSGVYFYRLNAGSFSATKKLLLMR